MINFNGIFRRIIKRDKTKLIKSLEKIVGEEIITDVEVSEPVNKPTSEIRVPVSEPLQIEVPFYGEALRQHLGYPKWFYDSQIRLKELGIHGEAQVAVARVSSPKQIQVIYSRLERIFALDARSFVMNVPWVFTYRNSYLENYMRKLMEVQTSSNAKFGHNTPPGFYWRIHTSSFKDLEALSKLEIEIKSFDKNGAESAELSKIREALQAAGYDFEIVSAIIVKGFNLYSNAPFIGYNYTRDRHVRDNADRYLKDKGKFAELFEPTLSILLRKKVLVEPTRKSHHRVYSLNPALNEIEDPALHAYISYVFSKKESLKRGT